VQRGDDWARTSRVTNNVTGTTTRVTQGSGGGTSVSRNTPGPGGSTVARTGSGDVYAGHDGNVYKKEGDSWQKYDNGGWSDVQQPTQAQKDQARSTAQERAGQSAGTTAAQTGARSGQAAGSNPTVNQLNSDRAARTEGAARTGAYSGYQRGTSSASSYRGGGATRSRPSGGGGRRR
jgi:hypothetical protein